MQVSGKKSNGPFGIRRATEDDGPAIVELRGRVTELAVPEKTSPEFWFWENIANPYGKSITMVAFAGEQLVSSVSLLPRRAWINGVSHPCWLTVESMTDPRFRSKGLFFFLWQAAEREVQKSHDCLLYGFPNRNAKPIFEHGFHWTGVGSPTLMIYPLRPEKVAASRLSPGLATLAGLPLLIVGKLWRIPFGQRYSGRLQAIDGFTAECSSFLERINRSRPIMLERSVDYLNWRYPGAVGRKYRILRVPGSWEAGGGYVVFRCAEHEGTRLGVIMDLQFDDRPLRSVARELLESAIAELADMNVDLVIGLATPGDRIAAVFRRSGFLPVPRRFNPNSFDLMFWSHGPLEGVHLLNGLENWGISFGDIDVF